jgi:hypothetical protein
MIPTYLHHSPSSLNQFAASPALFVLERVLGLKQVVGAPAHRGVAVEAGVAYGLTNLDRSNMDKTEKRAIQAAYTAYDTVSALSPDERKERYREDIPDMVSMALDELMPYGAPDETQGYLSQKFPGLQLPVVGFFDFRWLDKGIIVDLKTTERMPSDIKIPHARQVSLYCGDNHEGRLTYVTPKKCQTYILENVREHREALLKIAKTVENFLSLSDDPKFFTTIVTPDLDSFYWSQPHMRQLAYDHFGV